MTLGEYAAQTPAPQPRRIKTRHYRIHRSETPWGNYHVHVETTYSDGVQTTTDFGPFQTLDDAKESTTGFEGIPGLQVHVEIEADCHD